MTRRVQILTACVAGMILFTGGFLEYLKRNQRLGEPGVRLVPEPLFDDQGAVARKTSVYLPDAVSGYASESVPIQSLVLDWLPPDTLYGQSHYTAADGFWIRAGAVLMGGDRTSIHQPQYCLTGQGFQIVDERAAEIRVGGESGYDLPVKRIVARGTFREADGRVIVLSRLLVYWFVAKGSLTAEHDRRMWEQAIRQLKTGELQRWAYITCFAPCVEAGEEEAYERVAEFIARSAPEFVVH